MIGNKSGKSKTPVVIAVLVLAVAACAVYLGRDLFLAPEPTETPVEAVGDGTGTAILSESASPAAGGVAKGPSVEEPGLSSDDVADLIVREIITAVSEPDPQPAGGATEEQAASGAPSGTETAPPPETAAQPAAAPAEAAVSAETQIADASGAMPPAAPSEPDPQPAGAATGEQAASGAPSGTETAPPPETAAQPAAAPAEAAVSAETQAAAASGATPPAAPSEPDPQPAGAATGEQAASGTPSGTETAPPPETAAQPAAAPAEAAVSAETQAAAASGAAPPAAGDASRGAERDSFVEEVADRVAGQIADVVPAPPPNVVADATEKVAEELGLEGESLSRAVTEAVVAKQAQSYVDQITEPDPQPVEVDEADHFVTREQVISLLPESSFELTTSQELLSDPAFGPDMPITVVREVEQIRIADPAKVIASAGGDLDREVRVLDGNELRIKTVGELLADFIDAPGESISILSTVKYFEVTTPSEIASRSEGEGDEPLTVVKERYALEAATVAELLRQELDLPPDVIFYLRTVHPSDRQGIWGIVQDGIIGNFARGMAIRYGQSVSTYQVDIPGDADELLGDRSSSFLGKLIHTKTIQSHVYNFEQHRMGRNPDRIYPGQEIVIINFTPAELVSIFKHFVEQQSGTG